MIFSTHDVMSPSQLKRLADHKYSCCSSSVMDPIMQKYWNWLVNKIPFWFAPNLITITGLFINIVTSLLVVFYSPDARQDAPRWTFLLCALGLFVYQSLDAIDGKQARRTGTSSPLGELFDHGCDSISTVFVAISVCVAIQLGSHPAWMFFQCFAAISLFYCAHWQTYVSGTLRFGRFDVTEAQFGVMFVHLTSAILGPEFWLTKIPVLHLEIKLLIFILGGAAGSIALLSYFRTIFTGGIGKNGSTVAIPMLLIEWKMCLVLLVSSFASVLCYFNFSVIFTGGVGRNGSTVAGTSVLSPFIPFSLVVLPAFIIYRKSESHIYENHPCLYILAFGLVAAKVTNRLVVAHMTKSEMDYLDSVLIGPGMLFLNQYFNTAFNEYIVLWLCLIWSTFDLIRYCTVVCTQICGHLNIHLFKITPKLVSNVSQVPATPTSKNGTFLRKAVKR
uniref:diacylglycerol cholinephosphotransferase n=1 Tax=Strigamia maritima TaxID=126957 RepID=T1JDW7_STRMM